MVLISLQTLNWFVAFYTVDIVLYNKQLGTNIAHYQFTIPMQLFIINWNVFHLNFRVCKNEDLGCIFYAVIRFKRLRELAQYWNCYAPRKKRQVYSTSDGFSCTPFYSFQLSKFTFGKSIWFRLYGCTDMVCCSFWLIE